MAHVEYADDTRVDVPAAFPGEPPNVIPSSLTPLVFDAEAALPELSHDGWPVRRVYLDSRADAPIHFDWEPHQHQISLAGIFPAARGIGAIVGTDHHLAGWAMLHLTPSMAGRMPVGLALDLPDGRRAVGGVSRTEVVDDRLCVQFSAVVLPRGSRPPSTTRPSEFGELRLTDDHGESFWRAAAIPASR